MLEADEVKSIGVTAGLALLNITLMWALIYTPLAEVNNFVFEYLILGMLFYGVLITGGNYLGKNGVRNGNLVKALAGVALLQLAYGMFGAGVLSLLDSDVVIVGTVLSITAAVTLMITLISGLVVYATDRSFEKWNTYSAYAFMAALGAGLIGSFSGIFALITFVLVLLGFLLSLVYEIWNMKKRPGNVYLNGIGIYVAFMGVFVEILRLVVEIYLRE